MSTDLGLDPVSQRDLSSTQAVLALAAICTLSSVLGILVYAPCDDAYIFYVYAKNFAQGNGLTYNGTVVWGFTSILWVGLLSLLALLKVPLHVGGELLSAVSGWFAICATYALARGLAMRRTWALVPALLLATTGDFAFYSLVGLEQTLFTALIALSLSLVFVPGKLSWGRKLAVASSMAAMTLTRPEGVLFVACFLLAMALQRRSLKAPLICGISTLMLIAPVLVAFRWYFGDWLPNTYYVKSNSGLANLRQGLSYLSWALPRYSSVVAMGVLVVAWALKKRLSPHHVKAWWMLAITLLWLVYVALQGGDNMTGARVLIPILPLAYVALLDLAPRLPVRPFTAIALILSATLSISYLVDSRVARFRESWLRDYGIRYEAGIYLRDNFPRDTLVALNPAGIIPYFSGLPTIDMLGLNDRHIALDGKRDYRLRFGHQAGDGDYVLQRQPDIILLGGDLAKQPGRYISDQEIWASPSFREHYSQTYWQGIGFAFIRHPDL